MSESRYLKDDTLEKGYRDEGIINKKNLIIGTAIAAGSIFSYKKGYLSKHINTAMRMAAEKKPSATVVVNELREWLNSDFKTPRKSIFRNSILETLKDATGVDPKTAFSILKETKDFRKSLGALYKGDAKQRIGKITKDTIEDLNEYGNRLNYTLENLISARQKGGVNIYNGSHNTDLLRELKDIKAAKGFYSSKYKSASNALESEMTDDLIKRAIQSKDEAQKQLKRISSRNATLEDFFDYRIDEAGKIRLINKSNYKFSENAVDDDSAIDMIEKILNLKSTGRDGLSTLNKDGKPIRMYEKHNDFMKMKLDKNIFIDEGKNFIDLRDRSRNMNEFVSHLATDWEIPIIKINPLRMFGVDKLGKRKVNYASISENTIAPFLTGVRGNTQKETIRNLKDKVDVLKGVKEGVTIINGDVYRVSDDLNGIQKMAYKSKKRVIAVPKRLDGGTSALTPAENALRKMSGVSSKHFEDYTREDGFYKFYRQKFSKLLDIGYQERSVGGNYKDGFNIFESSNPDNFIGKVLKRISPKPYKSAVDSNTFSSMINPLSHGRNDSFFVVNSSTKMKDIFNGDKEKLFGYNSENLKRFMNQFGARFTEESFEDVTSTTGMPFFMIERLNQTLSSVGLGLSTDSTKDTLSTAKNLLLKRMLPVYAGYKAWDVLNMVGEDDEDRLGTAQQKILKAASRVDIGMHALTEKLGVSKVFKNLQELTPGSDMVGELPGLNLLKLGDTEEERREYWENGYKPIRKGRFWSLNSTPFIGGKVQYFRANALRTSMADAKYSDSLYGSRKERYSHILDRNYYDKRNYYTRPYLMTGTPFDNVPFAGPLLSSTVGRIFTPPKKMHEEYWNENAPKSMEQLKAEGVLGKEYEGFVKKYEGKLGKEYDSSLGNQYMESYKSMREKSNEQLQNAYMETKGIFQNVFKFGLPKEESPSIPPIDTSKLLGVVTPSDNLSIYKTNSGALSVVDLGKDSYKGHSIVNKQGKGLGQVIDARENVTIEDGQILTPDMVKGEMYKDPTSPYDLGNALEDQFVNTANVAGIYGFGVTGFVTGNPGASDTRIETSGYSRSFSKDFWEAELGGFGGDVSEIFRRFVQGRRKDVKYYNPIRNRMPEWLPGENGFIDFQHGDPYSKVQHGEERLPGEGYERLNNINTDLLFKMNVGSSTMGKTKEDMINHFLHADEITDERLQEIVDTGTRVHEKVERDMLKSGIAIDIEQKIEDKENGIVGWYDVRLHDASSKTGEAIMDIKTIGDKGFKEIMETGAPKDTHQRQVNWYLHNTNKDNKGYVHYINRDNPEETYTVGFNYDKDMYESSMNTLFSAREEVMNMLNNGTISRGDLYKTVDKFRILADVAPYSDEFREMNKVMSNMKLSEEDHKEVQAIRERVRLQKEPLRLYDYKFKYADTETFNTEIKRQVDAEKYTIEGSDSPIKLAGVNITKDNPNYEAAMEFLEKHLKEGANVKIKVAEDLLKRTNKDQLKTMNAVVYSDGMNINRELIKRGYAEEDKDDFSAAGVHARFNKLERAFGNAWENIAHFDSFANTKLLQVRSAAEDYERKQVFNKEFKEWQDPYDDFLKPFAWTNMNRTGGVLIGAGVGYLIGSKNNRFGKLAGALIGGASIGLFKMYKAGYETVKGEGWVPEEKRREREIHEYVDKLKFIKNRKLFEYYSEKALSEDGIDVKEIIASNRAMGNSRKSKARKIEKVKVQDKKEGTFSKKAYEEAGVEFAFEDKLPEPVRRVYMEGKHKLSKIKNIIKPEAGFKEEFEYKDKEASMKDTISATLKSKKESRNTFELSLNATKAIDYYNQSEKTMYGYDPGEEINNIISALPKADRQYFRKFLEAPEKEREKILNIAPNYMRRALQSAYKMKVDEKEDLSNYFKEHYLPSDDWDGWRENYDLDSMKVKIIQQQNMELGSFDKWEQDKVKADMYGPTAIPNINYKTRDVQSVRNKLKTILSESGYKDLEFSYSFAKGASSINIEMNERLEDKYNEKLKERLGIN